MEKKESLISSEYLHKLWPIVLNAIIGTAFVVNLGGKIDRNGDKLLNMAHEVELIKDDNKVWHATIEADIAAIHVRLAIIENQIANSYAYPSNKSK